VHGRGKSEFTPVGVNTADRSISTILYLQARRNKLPLHSSFENSGSGDRVDLIAGPCAWPRVEVEMRLRVSHLAAIHAAVVLARLVHLTHVYTCISYV
jgi:hypothetical protein